jgi:VIT1/CCC1 family predicted Fe2+/Mn2+ transporter
VLVFLLGVFLGRIADISWLRSGLQTLLVAVATAGLVYLFAGG